MHREGVRGKMHALPTTNKVKSPLSGEKLVRKTLAIRAIPNNIRSGEKRIRGKTFFRGVKTSRRAGNNTSMGGRGGCGRDLTIELFSTEKRKVHFTLYV